MAWVVDTCLLLDIALPDATFGDAAAELLDGKRSDGLVICPMTYIELAPFFQGRVADAQQFIGGVGVSFSEVWTDADTTAAFAGWNHFIVRRRSHNLPRRPLADALIGAFAQRFEGVLTRNAADFRLVFPNLKIVEP